MSDPLASETGSADRTRKALVHAALRLFGQKGFEATSTREIAAAAQANIGSIAYHFGGKDGLRAACADHIVTTMRGIAGQALAASPGNAVPDDPATGAAHFRRMLETLVGFIVGRPEAGEIVQFILREMTQPSPALDVIYAGVFEPVHRQLCARWAALTGEEPESDLVKITVFTLIGQAVYFRIGREPVLRRMGWATIGPAEAGHIAAVAGGNFEAILAARRRMGKGAGS